ncbi:MAG: MFS transporter [Bacteroidales bacterium]|nr:MFS transporter [Bacteroidales bacterium]
MTIAVIMYKNLGLSNTEIALYTSWLYLPWVIKPLWSPFIDLIKTKRAWIIAMQSLIAAAFAGIAFFIPTTHFVQATLAFFWIMAFASATHDIAADGFYMHGLSEGDQSLFAGIRNLFYRIASIFGQGVLVMLAGFLAEGKLLPQMAGNVALSWSLCFYLLAAIFIAIALYHNFILPKPASDKPRSDINAQSIWKNFVITFFSFFKKEHAGLMFFFLLTYRLGESQLAKIAQPFMLDSQSAGGLALSTANVGLIYGTLGVIALLTGGVLSGIVISKNGFKKWIVPMALMLNLPDLLYVVMAIFNGSQNFFTVSASVIMEQFGYGFGFTAYTMYLIYVAKGENKTAHYAIGTGFMALGMMLPGMIAGWMADKLGYTLFFIWVCLCTIPSIIAALSVKRIIPDNFGKKDD